MKSHLIGESPLLKKHKGKCALCGKEAVLTFEHIPPRSANNSKPAKPIPGEEFFKTKNHLLWDTTGMRYYNQQKGMGLYSLCRDCNSLTGTLYGNAYIEFVKRAVTMIKLETPQNHDVVDFKKIYPLRIFKQICSMFCSVNYNLPFLDNMREFVLDKESNSFDKTKYRIQMYFNKGRMTKYNSFMCLVNTNKPIDKLIELSELVVPPFGFQLILNPTMNQDYNGFDITSLADCKYDDVVTVSFPLVFNEVNSIFPNDYRSQKEIIVQAEESEAE